MKNPFPGMNPWLELHWRDTHTSLIIYIRDQLQAKLPSGLRARVEEDVAIGLDHESRHLRPDVHISEPWQTSTGGTATVAAPSTSAGLLVMVEPEVERHISIADADGEVITAIEVLSPTNKEPGEGLTSYRAKQRTYLEGGVNLVEIDLLRGGSFALSIKLADVPKKRRTPYMACVFRAGRSAYREIFPMPLREPLPAISIPLRRGEPEIALELQPLIDRCCEHGGYGPADYAQELDPPLTFEEAAWAEECLLAAGLRAERRS